MTDINYQGIEVSLLQLIKLLGGIFSQSEIQEVQDFVDAGEYGLALETLVDIVDEEDKKISNEIVASILQLADKMSMDREALFEKLQGHTE